MMKFLCAASLRDYDKCLKFSPEHDFVKNITASFPSPATLTSAPQTSIQKPHHFHNLRLFFQKRN